ncbi:hypothetical protein LTR37_018298 [Vermiconidia calcicola]|uniref:Uncharacterized protein n=1 Tax=Vermiconidia calcicola TaxID=1690605 RepID=A0ACC3MJ56_9PEZI|nr:hypothetical protein LTR37_018298 [Vermiconidia calcicola]
MSSEQRASSAVRNLRSLFENKHSSSPAETKSPNPRGRSPGGLINSSSDKENSEGLQRPTPKVRASFVSVGPDRSMAAAPLEKQESSAGQRRGSFREADDDGALLELKKTVSQQQESREVPDGVIDSTAGTPLRKLSEGQDESPLAQKADKMAANPDKHVTGVEEEPAEMKPADPASEEAVSGGEALPPVAKDLRPETKPATPSASAGKKTEDKKATTNGKPAAVSTKAPQKASSGSIQSPASQPKTPTSSKEAGTSAKTHSAAQKEPLRKASRSSLTAPTAASLARTGSTSEKDKAHHTTKPSASSASKPHPKPRDATKPVHLPSHLTAPTASSRAKHDPTPSATTSSTFKSSTTSRPKQPPSSKPTLAQKSSLLAPHNNERPGSRSSQTSARRSFGTDTGGSFLERMMKPTAASAGKTHEKLGEGKSPPKGAKAAAMSGKGKINGSASSRATSKPATAVSAKEGDHVNGGPAEAPPAPQAEAAESAVPTNGAEEPAAEKPAASINGIGEKPQESPKAACSAKNDGTSAGVETPIPSTNGVDETLEATPAAMGGEDMIR